MVNGKLWCDSVHVTIRHVVWELARDFGYRNLLWLLVKVLCDLRIEMDEFKFRLRELISG